MKDVSLRNTAVVRDDIASSIPNQLSLGSIDLVDYKPHHLTYASKNNGEGLAVFGEIYYPIGWKVYIDGQETDFLRVDYFLRGLVIPAGEHQIEFRFEPTSYSTGESISLAGSILLMLLTLGALAKGIVSLKND